MNTKFETKTARLATSGILIALATILSMIKVFEYPYGGSVTLFSMVPIIVLGYMYGIGWGLLCGTVYGVLQGVLGATVTQAFAGVNGFSLVLMAFLDYIVAFAVLGLSAAFKKTRLNNGVSLVLGTVLVSILRFGAHFLSGYILWGGYAQSFFEGLNSTFGNNVLSKFSGNSLALVYSAFYNGSYMLPEMIISIVGVLALIAVKPLREIIFNTKSSANSKKTSK